ncbi:MAG: trehalose-phosphatase [Peptococcaceae bacterium]|nr:trehalose-phosphatase [Peptococcaceae bacterium]
MLSLTSNISPNELVTKIPADKFWLMLDYDGTLVPIADTPWKAIPDQTLRDLLTALAHRPGIKIAIISGRPLADLADLLPSNPIYLVASHGLTIRYPDGSVEHTIDYSSLKPVIDEIAREARLLCSRHSGLLIEHKEAGLALHYRLAEPTLVPAVVTAFRDMARPYLESYSLELLPGKKVLELRPRGVNKGSAVIRLLDLHNWFPVYIGDDFTDEEVFRHLKGWGCTVLVSRESRTTAARFRLRHPGDVREFLALLTG